MRVLTQPAVHIPLISPTGRSEHLDAVDCEALRKVFREYGIFLLRGFRASPEDFVRFGERFSQRVPVKHYQTGSIRKPVRAGGTDYLVGVPTTPWSRIVINKVKQVLKPEQEEELPAGGTQISLTLHAEMAYSPSRPAVLLMNCTDQAPPGTGGCTTVCDGRQLLRALPDRVVDAFRQKKLRFSIPNWPVSLKERVIWGVAGRDVPQSGLPSLGMDEQIVDGQSRFVYSGVDAIVRDLAGEESFANSLLQPGGEVTWEDGSAIDPELIAAVDEVSTRHAHWHDWKEHDILCLDNYRFMHGRAWIETRKRVVLVTMYGDPVHTAKEREPEAVV